MAGTVWPQKASAVWYKTPSFCFPFSDSFVFSLAAAFSLAVDFFGCFSLSADDFSLAAAFALAVAFGCFSSAAGFPSSFAYFCNLTSWIFKTSLSDLFGKGMSSVSCSDMVSRRKEEM